MEKWRKKWKFHDIIQNSLEWKLFQRKILLFFYKRKVFYDTQSWDGKLIDFDERWQRSAAICIIHKWNGNFLGRFPYFRISDITSGVPVDINVFFSRMVNWCWEGSQVSLRFTPSLFLTHSEIHFPRRLLLLPPSASSTCFSFSGWWLVRTFSHSRFVTIKFSASKGRLTWGWKKNIENPPLQPDTSTGEWSSLEVPPVMLQAWIFTLPWTFY